MSWRRFAPVALALSTVVIACEPFTGGPGGTGGASSGTEASTSGSGSMSDTSSSTGMEDCTITGCTAGANATAECKDKKCEYTCTALFASCDAVPSDCEVDLSADGNCGGCAVNCAKSCAAFGATFGCTEVVEIAAGDNHTCARTGTGVVWCWGDNAQGQLGIGDGAAFKQMPTKVDLQFPAGQLSARGNATCVVGQGGELACWGNDGTASSTPLKYTPPSSAARVAVAGQEIPDPDPDTFGKSLVLLATGEVRSFTLSNLGNPSFGGVATAQAGVAAGGLHACIFDAAGVVRCQGDDTRAQLGHGAPNSGMTLMPVGGASAVELAAGYQHTCALDQSGGMTCWGDNQFHQASDTTDLITGAPDPVDLTDVDHIGAGGRHSAAIKAGKLFLWGDNMTKQSSQTSASTVASPTEYTGLGGSVVAVALGGSHTCALLHTGVLKCWGDNTYAQVAGAPSAPIAAPAIVNVP